MEKYQIDQSFRLEPAFGLEDWKGILAAVIDQMAYDEDTLFEIIMEDSQLKRRTEEKPWRHVNTFMAPEVWESFHQMMLSNHWIKGMNIKFHLVKRPDHLNLSIKCGLDDMAQRQRVEEKIQSLLQPAVPSSRTVSRPTVEDLEALFGAMLLTESVATPTKGQFLRGDMQACLKTAQNLILEELHQKTGLAKDHYYEVINLFTQKTPYLLLPDLSGPRLREELESLGLLLVGTVSVMKAILDYKDSVLHDPPQILKYLVLTSMIMDRLENTVKNPAYSEEQARQAVVVPAAPSVKKTTGKKVKAVKKRKAPKSPKKTKKTVPTGKAKSKGAGKKAGQSKALKGVNKAVKATVSKSAKPGRREKAASAKARSSKRS